MAKRKRAGTTPAREWTPFQRVKAMSNRVTGVSTPVPDDIALYGNNLYNVLVRVVDDDLQAALKREHWVSVQQEFLTPGGEAPRLLWLSISRRDRKTVLDWRHLQRIKNEIVGEECEAVQLFPAESRLVDTSNQFHLFALESPKARFPFGYTAREVATPAELAADPSAVGAVQREWEFEL